MLGSAQGVRIGITGLGVHVPEKVMTNEELAGIVETSDEWIRERTGIRERRVAGPNEALSDFCLPAAREALNRAGVRAEDLDLLVGGERQLESRYASGPSSSSSGASPGRIVSRAPWRTSGSPTS